MSSFCFEMPTMQNLIKLCVGNVMDYDRDCDIVLKPLAGDRRLSNTFLIVRLRTIIVAKWSVYPHDEMTPKADVVSRG